MARSFPITFRFDAGSWRCGRCGAKPTAYAIEHAGLDLSKKSHINDPIWMGVVYSCPACRPYRSKALSWKQIQKED